jgi:LAO/AO transport system kinase
LGCVDGCLILLPMTHGISLSVLFDRAREGDTESTRALLHRMERNRPERDELLRLLAGCRRKAHRIGLAGPPGSGKSTLLVQLASHFGEQGARVGVLSIDATGTGEGRRLGDRLRMNELHMAENVYVHSAAVHPGGEKPTLLSSLGADLLDALGHDPIFVESIGLGRAQIDIVDHTHSVVLIVPPGSVEPSTLIGAGLLELADLIVVNMADRDDAEALVRELEQGIAGRQRADGEWTPRVVATVAYRGEHVDLVLEALVEHREILRQGGEWAQRQQAAILGQLLELAEEELVWRVRNDPDLLATLDRLSKDVFNGQLDAALARDRALESFLGRRLL